MKTFMYMICQCTWGILQTVMGLIVFLAYSRNKHYFYHGALVTEWKNSSSVSLGMFIFIAEKPYKKLMKEYSLQELSDRLLVHEYGHTIQSLILGPLYLFVIGIPSVLWANLFWFKRKRKVERISYFSLFTEKWANHLGEKVLKKESMKGILID